MKEQTLTLEDQLAISMPSDKIPTLNNDEAIEEAVNILGMDLEGLTFDELPLQEQLEFAFKWQAYCRYSYAEAMKLYRP